MELSAQLKSLPSRSWGMTEQEFLATQPRRSDFATPLLTLDRGAMAHNVAVMREWTSERGLELAPHGKTTMAPQLWRQVLDAGAWGITLATGWQVQLARSFGIRRILLANELVDPVTLRWVATELADPGFEFTCWVDSEDAVAAMRATLVDHAPARPIDVLVDLGAEGGRTGARGDALGVVRAIEAAPELRLAGIAGWEGGLASGRAADGLNRVRTLMEAMADLLDRVAWNARPIVTAGGSAYFDIVADVLGALTDRATVVLRSGAYQVHDSVHYADVSPLRDRLRAGMHGWARVLSVPEPGLAILDGGKRDFPYDFDLPVPSPIAGPTAARIRKVNDQHAFLEFPADHPVRVGEVVRLGLSHPCTAFDKWRVIPVVDDADSDDPLVVDLVRTYF
jgi:D-serine deaminase-like pyridoxal phosphate-dependent protein